VERVVPNALARAQIIELGTTRYTSSDGPNAERSTSNAEVSDLQKGKDESGNQERRRAVFDPRLIRSLSVFSLAEEDQVNQNA
jgi:hypothetical protein